jgi:phosphate-selective porin OprO and OprP
MRPLHLVLTAALAAAYTTATLAQQAPAPAIPTSPTADVATPAPAAAATEEPSPYDRIWNRFSQVYRNDMNPAIQQVLFTGRFQHDFAMLDADEGEHEESNIRRVRLGPRIRFLRDYLFHAEVELNPQERDPLYVRFTDLYVQWSKSDAVTVTAGKQNIPFTQEGATSSKELLTIDRSNLANNIWFSQEYMPGISVSGTQAPWVYRVGAYSSGAANREVGEFSGGYFALGLIGYDFGEALGADEALLTGNYVYQQPDADNSFTQRFEQIASVHFRLALPRWGVRSELSTASGYLGQSDVRAMMAMPFLNLTNELQLVGRYTLVDSAGPNGLRLATYENRVVGGRGDRYDELYVGANYYFYGHKLKLQSGLQWGNMDDEAADGGAYSGASWVTGLRVSW